MRIPSRPIILINARIQTKAMLLQRLQQDQQDHPCLDGVRAGRPPRVPVELDLEDRALGFGALDFRAEGAEKTLVEFWGGVDDVEEVAFVEGEAGPCAGWGGGLLMAE